ncbi:hypothetical protein [Psychrobacter sp. P2G3]|uniref:hypothetical protein n=1 Tax=Psychrobacter sp. P2G3 TaxID=1699622 RepID=UPI00082FF7F3|nr:hypothetical protein [Psychrobacter sp. P2G3]
MMLMDISFSCECGERIKETVYVPAPNFMAEQNKDSGSEHYEEIHCDKCHKEHEILVVNTFSGADCYVTSDGSTDVSFGMPYFPESDYNDDELAWIMQSETQIEIFQNHIKSVEKILEADIDAEAYFSLLVMLYGHVVAAVEAYLSSTFIHKVTNSEELTRKLIETDPKFSNMKFTLKEIFEEQEKLKITVANYLKDLIFHDLKKVKPMYKDVLDCEFGDISWLFKAVIIRHHCVHRAGYDKENTKIELSVEILRELVTRAQDLTSLIESKLHPTSLTEFDLSF